MMKNIDKKQNLKWWEHTPTHGFAIIEIMTNWDEWQKLVVYRLDKIDEHIKIDVSEHERMRMALETLKLQVSITSKVYGLIGGSIPAIVIFIYWLVGK